MFAEYSYCRVESLGITCGQIEGFHLEDGTYTVHILAKDDTRCVYGFDKKIHVDSHEITPILQPYVPAVGDIVQLSPFCHFYPSDQLNNIVLARVDKVNHSNISDYLYGEILEALTPEYVGRDIEGWAWWCFRKVAPRSCQPNNKFLDIFE